MLRKSTHIKILSFLFALLLCGCSSTGTVKTTAPVSAPIAVPSITESTATDATNTSDISAPQTATTQDTIPADSHLEVHYIDVGQADSALILCDGEAMLIDGGNVADSNLIYTYLEKNHIDHLNTIVVTHAHEDHCGGIAGALSYATVDTLYSPVTEYNSKAFSNVVKKLADQDKSITVPHPGDQFMIGSALITIVGPIKESDEPNNTSIVLRLDYGETSFLFTGDAEREEENDILDAGYDVSCNVLKTGHHGSETSTSYRWLREVDPEYAIISCGKDNSYGHPHEAVISRFNDAEVQVMRTDLLGDIVATSDGKSVTFHNYPNGYTKSDSGDSVGVAESSPIEATSDDDVIADPDNPSEEITYVLNTNSGKFHIPSCHSAEKISEHNRKEVTCSKDELIAQGYVPCKNCNP